MLIIAVPPPGLPDIYEVIPSSSLLYEHDFLRMTCRITGGFPLANLTWSCPDLGSTEIQPGGNSTTKWSTITGNISRNLDGEHCTCTARHYAWLPYGFKSTTTHSYTVYCKHQVCLFSFPPENVELLIIHEVFEPITRRP